MKKLFSLMLAVLIVLSITACGEQSKPVAAETAAPTEAPVAEPTTEPTAEPTASPTEPEEPVITAEELLLLEETQTIENADHSKYMDILYELGFTEVRYDAYGEYVFQSMTYNSVAFKIVFDTSTRFMNESGEVEEIVNQGWIMYGTKADGLVNISGIPTEAYNYIESAENGMLPMSNNYTVPQKFRENPLAPRYDLYMYVAENEKAMRIDRWASCFLAYYPTTGNLYNFMRQEEGDLMLMIEPPFMVDIWEEHFTQLWNEQELPTFSPTLYECAGPYCYMVEGPSDLWLYSGCYYEPEMTLLDWVDSLYNYKGWVYQEFETGSALVSPCGQFVMPIVRNQDGVETIESYRSGLFCEVPAFTMENYKCEYLTANAQ